VSAEESLEARVSRLEAFQAISELKARYARLADAKYTASHERVALDEWHRIAAQQAACFTEDARWEGGAKFGGMLQGRDALTGWFAQSPWRFALHYYVAQEIRLVAADRAEGRWRLWQIGLPTEGRVPVLLAGVTREHYRRDGQGWLIERMSFEEIHTVELTGSELKTVR
jgi:hypothetical protein